VIGHGAFLRISKKKLSSRLIVSALSYSYHIRTIYDRAENNAPADHEHRQVLVEVVALVQNHDSHDHVGDQGASSENHVQRHRYIEIERVIVTHAGHEEQHHQHGVVLKTNSGFHGEEFRCENQTVQSDEHELRTGDEVARSGVGSEKKLVSITYDVSLTKGYSLLLDQQLQEDDIGATARKDDKYRRYGLCVHRG
jgi:hypothetical protein